ncbi:hypothetical protein BpHYR1_024805 [Brachionus plicatilis]|uniref:Uncharacterized protein n=1 Tax=Brachionus plicatilis TaxID=10195 RepID=A0A3M7RY98_BRAPC|nr:hypothetical protein BpHYR1_024805 [Brachionus plicatilis]
MVGMLIGLYAFDTSCSRGAPSSFHSIRGKLKSPMIVESIELLGKNEVFSEGGLLPKLLKPGVKKTRIRRTRGFIVRLSCYQFGLSGIFDNCQTLQPSSRQTTSTKKGQMTPILPILYPKHLKVYTYVSQLKRIETLEKLSSAPEKIISEQSNRSKEQTYAAPRQALDWN